MFSILLIVLVVAAVMVIFTVQNSRAMSGPGITTRLGRFGIVAPTEIATVSATNRQQQSPVTRSVERMMGTGHFAARTGLKLEQANITMTGAEFMTISAAVLAVTTFGGLLIRGPLGLIIGLVLGAALPQIYLRRRVAKRRKAFVNQLADMAQMMANSMRAGFSIIQSMETVARDAPAPASEEFARVVSEVRLGLPIDAALQHLNDRMPSEDLGLMIVAINVQRQVGGNLAEILDVISRTVRERVRFQRDLRTLTAQARISSYIITALPIAVAIIINFLDGPYESFLYTTLAGHVMLGTAVVMISVGFFVLNKIATIEI